MINTLIFRNGDNLGCHVVGLYGCVQINEQELEPINNLPCFKYTAIYENSKEFEIQDIILASDQELI